MLTPLCFCLALSLCLSPPPPAGFKWLSGEFGAWLFSDWPLIEKRTADLQRRNLFILFCQASLIEIHILYCKRDLAKKKAAHKRFHTYVHRTNYSLSQEKKVFCSFCRKNESFVFNIISFVCCENIISQIQYHESYRVVS